MFTYFFLFSPTCTEDGSHQFCKDIATKVTSDAEFPVECKQYADAFSLFQRHNSGAMNAYEGMSPGEATDARPSQQCSNQT